MKMMLAVFTLALGSTAALAGDYSVKTVDGNIVQVSADELVAAYSAFIKDPGINTRVTNGDGTITVLNPRVSYAGKQVRAQGDNGYNDESKNNLKGLCAYFKLGGFTSVESSWTGDEVVILSSKGVVKETSGFSYKIQADSVTCKAK